MNGVNVNPNTIFSANFKDPISLLEELLPKVNQNDKTAAESKAKEIERIAKALKVLNLEWNQIMKVGAENTNPSDVKTKYNINGGSTVAHYNEIDRIIKTEFNDTRGISAIISDGITEVSNGGLQAINASVIAFCDSHQVDVDTLQNEFKNLMTRNSSGMEEYKNLEQFKINLCTPNR
ncbi:hypothetical protein [Citrobacter portucalensis]|uniref:hypothetical protein n=1 Tax=Citrobacter portucalensis TaxID=1639133 RepID=UPI00226B69D3|nr:hypothetical protein [Citrobacter portucalensis]MCX8985950.1 hypothetical protein [Citrobacter portucalensis]